MSAPRCLVVAGARPQFVKAAALLPALRARAETLFVHSGQHGDAAMVEAHFEGLGLPEPDVRVELPAGALGVARRAAMAAGVTRAAREFGATRVVVMGDTDTTLAAAEAARDLALGVSHVEAGARSGEPDLPEERIRIAVDALSDQLFCATEEHARHLAGREGVFVVGDVMADVFLAREPAIRARMPAGDYSVLTLHRAGTADDPAAVARVLAAAAADGRRVVFPRHPRTQVVDPPPRVELRPPMPYLDFLGLVAGASVLLTDSGGLQKEAYLLGVPCVTLRDATEWGGTVAAGWNVLAGTDPARIAAALATPPRAATRPPLFGDGRAAERIAELVGGAGDDAGR